jgi:hypothetical protein
MGGPGVFMNHVADVSEIMAFRVGCLSSLRNLRLSLAVVSPSRVSSYLPGIRDGEMTARRSKHDTLTLLDKSPCCC